MKHITAAFLALFSLSLFAQTPSDKSKVVLTIGDEKITAGEFDDIVASLPQQYQLQARGEGKRAFAEQLVQLKLLAAEAKKEKVDQQEKVKKQVAFSSMTIVAGAMFQDMQDHIKVDDATIEKYYNDHKNEYEMVHARQILVKVKGGPTPAPDGKPELSDDEAKAKAESLRKRILGGEDFGKIAMAESYDSSSSQGGDLGEFARGTATPAFEDAAFALKVGEVSEPVRSLFGYHVIRVESHYTKTLAQVKSAIEAKLRPDMARKALDGMRSGAKVDIDDGFFGPATMQAVPTSNQ